METTLIILIIALFAYLIFKDILHYKNNGDLQDRLTAKNLVEYKDLKKEEKEKPEGPKEEKQKYVPIDEAPLEDVKNTFEGTQEDNN